MALSNTNSENQDDSIPNDESNGGGGGTTEVSNETVSGTGSQRSDANRILDGNAANIKTQLVASQEDVPKKTNLTVFLWVFIGLVALLITVISVRMLNVFRKREDRINSLR